MKLGINTGYWSSGPPAGVEASIAAAERLGFDSMWTAEAYGSDALTPLAWWGPQTTSMRLGTAIMQMSARTPAAAAMAAISMDHLSGGRFILGLGASGPQVVEGWYGQEYPRPLARTREYVEIIRRIVAREEPVEFHGDFYSMPVEGGAGLGKALKSTVHPLRTRIPIMIAAEGPKNVALAAEIADGWLPLFFSPKSDAFYRDAIAAGTAKRTHEPVDGEFEVMATVPVVIGDDTEGCADFIRTMLALYIGGMGAKGQNFHNDVFVRMGWEAECETIQDLYLAGDKKAAIAAVPTAMVEDVALVGPAAKIAEELTVWKQTCLTGLLVSGPPPVLEQIAELVG
ncbi:MAG: LLM class F420-dependent oxidoreductase [Ilumatobacteraceae bacterium]